MIEIAPSILSSDFSRMREEVQRLDAAGADWIHFDVMDGQFVPPITFGAKMAADLRGCTSLPFEAHLMTLTPERHFDAFQAAGCRRIIFHAEATSHAHRLIQDLHQRGLEAGLAINPASPVEVLWPVLNDLDLVLVMTVNPGWGGQALIRSCLDKIKAVRERSAVPIEVDGGIDAATIRDAHISGATVFVAGSFLASATDQRSAMEAMRAACVD